MLDKKIVVMNKISVKNNKVCTQKNLQIFL